jgi:hypothetical protein
VKAISMTFNPTKPQDTTPATTPQQHHEQAAHEHAAKAQDHVVEATKKPALVSK